MVWDECVGWLGACRRLNMRTSGKDADTVYANEIWNIVWKCSKYEDREDIWNQHVVWNEPQIGSSKWSTKSPNIRPVNLRQVTWAKMKPKSSRVTWVVCDTRSPMRGSRIFVISHELGQRLWAIGGRRGGLMTAHSLCYLKVCISQYRRFVKKKRSKNCSNVMMNVKKCQRLKH